MSEVMKKIELLENELGIDARLAVEEWQGDLQVLVFMENRRGGDPIALNTEGRPVFPDKYRGGEDILAGEAWLCDVTGKGEGAGFAAPIWRIDRDMVSELGPLQQRRIAEALVDGARDLLKPVLREIAAEDGLDLDDDTAHLVQEVENLRANLAELEEQYDDAAGRVRQQELEIRTLREQLATDEAPEGNGQALTPTAEATAAPWVSLGSRRSDEAVLRVHEDVLESLAFTADRYYGHVSPNHRVLFFKPHHNGNLPCVNGRLTVPDLTRVLPYDDGAEYTAAYDSRHGGWFVRV